MNQASTQFAADTIDTIAEQAIGADNPNTTDVRKIIYRTQGKNHGGITRLVSPGDLGELIKPFVFLDLFSMKAGGPAMNMHPHSGIATVTVVLDGSLEYRETTGQHGTLSKGGVEWMSAGGGVWHGGNPIDHVRGFQLWLALPQQDENSPAQSRYMGPEEVQAEGPVRVIIGSHGKAGSKITTRASINYLQVTLRDGNAGATSRPPAIRWRGLPTPAANCTWPVQCWTRKWPCSRSPTRRWSLWPKVIQNLLSVPPSSIRTIWSPVITPCTPAMKRCSKVKQKSAASGRNCAQQENYSFLHVHRRRPGRYTCGIKESVTGLVF